MKSNLKFLTLSLFILLVQNSLAAKYEAGTGSVAHSERSVAIGLFNEAGDSTKPTEKFFASALGYDNKASGKNSSAFGRSNTASGDFSSTFGSVNKANGDYSSAFGYNNETSGDFSSTFGSDNKANEDYSSAFGRSNKASGIFSSAFGCNNEASGLESSAFGYMNTASGKDSSAFGHWNKASGLESSAFGNEVFVSGEGSGAFGKGKYGYLGNYLYKIEGDNSWAIGSYNKIAAGSNNNHILGNNVAVGTGITGSIVLGHESTVEDSNTLSIGSATNKRRIVHVAEGTADTDAVNKKQMDDAIVVVDTRVTTVNGNLNTRMDNFANATEATIDTDAWKAKLGVGAPVDAYTKAETDTKLAAKADKADVHTKAQADSKFLDKTTYNTDKATFATKSELDGKANIADVNTKVNKDGSNLSASDVATWKTKLGVGTGGGSIGAYTKAETDTKLDTKADKADVYSKAQTDSKFLDKSVYNTDKANFATKTELDGKADKANVYSKVETDNKLNTKADKDGSNLSASDIATWKAKLATGSVSGIANTATGTGSTGLGHGNVVTGNYSTAVGYKNNVSGNNSGAFGDPNTITGDRSYAVGNDNNIAGDDNFVVGSNVTIAKDVNNSVALGNNSTVSNSNEVSVGSAGKERKITNVADGVVSATSTDAVNGKQLFNVANSISSEKTDVLRRELIRENEKVKNEVRQVGSLSAALSALHPLQFDKNKPNQIMAGFGQYRDKSAVAVGMAHYFTENLMMTGGVSLSEGSNTKAMANVGLTWKFGKGGSQETMNTNNMYSVQEEVRRLTVENKKYMAKVTEQQSEIETLKTDKIIQDKKIQKQEERIKNLEANLEKLLKTK